MRSLWWSYAVCSRSKFWLCLLVSAFLRRTLPVPERLECAQDLEMLLENVKPTEQKGENFMKAMPYYFQ